MAKKLKGLKLLKKFQGGSSKPAAVKAVNTNSVITPVKPKQKFNPEDEARIQAEIERIKKAKHEQMIAEEIRNRAANI